MRHHLSARRRFLLLSQIATIVSPLGAPIVNAAPVSWAVDSDGSWQVAANWSPGLPGVADVVTISRPAGDFLVTLGTGNQSINSLTSDERLLITGTGTLTFAADSIMNNALTLAGGALAGSGSLTLNSAAVFDSGTLTGTAASVNTTVVAGLTISGGGNKFFTRRTITNNSATTWTAGQMNTGVGALFVNSATGTFTTNFDGSWLYNQGGAAPSFSNQGTLTKSGGTGVTQFSTDFDNSGTVNVNTGTLQLTGGGTDSGTFNLAAPATLDIAFGTHTLNSGASIAGAGTLNVSAGTLTANAAVTFGAHLTMTGGILNGSGAVSLASSAEWASGTFTGAGSTDINAGLTIDTAGVKVLTQRTLTNNSTTTWSASTVNTGSGGDFINASGATFNTSFDGSWLYNQGGAAPTFTNAGTFNKSAGAGATVMGIQFNNTGTVNINSGTLQLSTGGTNSGAFALADNTTLQITNANYNLNTGTTITGGTTTSLAVPSGTMTVNAAMTLSAPLTVSGGTITGTGALKLDDPAEWAAGTFTGAGSTTFTGGLTIDTAGVKVFTVRTLVNPGTTTWSAGTMNVGSAANFTNPVGGVFNNTFDGSWLQNQGGAASTFANAGTFNKSGGTGITAISTAFNNTGTVNVSTGTLSLQGAGSSNSAAFVVSAPATLEFSSTSYAINSGATITGAGTAVLTSGTVTVNAAVSLGITSFQYNAGTLNGTGTLTHTSPVTWTGSTMSGLGVTNFNAGLSLQSSTTKTLSQRTINNNATTTWSAGQVNTGGTANFVNSTGATFNNTFDGSWLANLGGGGSSFTNQGTFNKSAGTGTTTFTPVFHNAGAVSVTSGTLSLQGGSTQAGSLTAASGATIDFGGGTHTLNSGATFAGAGTGSLSAGTLTASAPVTFSVANFNFDAGIQNGTGSLTLTGTTTWTGTTFNGLGSTTFAGPLIISGGTTRTLSQRTLAASGATTWSGGQINTGGQVSFTNAPTGTIDNSFDGSWLFNLGGGGASFTNQGTLTKSAGSGTTTFTPTFSNTGTVNVNSGTLSFANAAQLSAGTLTAGTWNAYNATLVVTTGTDITTIAAGAAVKLSGPSSVFTRVNTLANNQGSFTVDNARNFTTVGSLTNSGALTASAGSNVLVSGNLDNSGTVNVTGGSSLASTSATQISGTVLNGGIWNVSNGTIGIAAGPDVTSIGPSAAVTLDGPLSSFTKLNPVINNQGSFTVTNGRTFTTVGSLTNSGTLTIGPGSAFKVVGTLTNTGAVNMNTGSLLLDYVGGSSIDALRTQLLSGRNGGAWNGAGVRSSAAASNPQQTTGIGYVEASTFLGLSGSNTAMYAGLPVDATTVLTKVTYYGDTNLDGKVDLDDLVRVDRGFAKHLAGWINGDFNYDGSITAADYTLIDRALILQGTPLSPDLLAQRELQFGPDYVANLLASVPEPSLLVPLAACLPVLPRRRRPFYKRSQTPS